MPETVESVPAASVRAQLARILASRHFVPSQRMCRFLRFLVERALENDTARLKEFVVALEVFDRKEDYDPNVDSIVRVEARRLRGKLKAYYDDEGSRDPVLIGLRPGTYVPLFRLLAPPSSSQQARLDSGGYTAVAVLPFVNMSPEPEQDYFCDGITEELINALASVETLNVVARTSAFQFKGKAVDVREVGERLGAQVIVEGSVRKAGSQLRVTAQAIDAARGYHLWSETYRREMQDIFAIQEELSAAIANTLKARLPARTRPAAARSHPSLEAYTGFLRAMFLVHQQNIAGLYQALDQFRALIRTYPDYAQPYAGLAAARAMLSLFGVLSGSDALPEIRRCAEEAVRLDPDSADAWAVLAGISAHWDCDWAKGEECFRRAIALQPGSSGPRAWFGMMLVMLGRMAEAETELIRVAQLNPLAPSDHARMGYLSYLRRRDAEAASHLDKALRLDPDSPEGRLYPGLLLIRQARYQEAIDVLSRNLDRLPLAVHIGLLAAAYGFWGKHKESRAWLARLEAFETGAYVTPLAYAWAHLGLGDQDTALDCLERAIANRTVFVQFLNVDSLYDPLRSHPRFPKLMKSLNLPDGSGAGSLR